MGIKFGSTLNRHPEDGGSSHKESGPDQSQSRFGRISSTEPFLAPFGPSFSQYTPFELFRWVVGATPQVVYRPMDRVCCSMIY